MRKIPASLILITMLFIVLSSLSIMPAAADRAASQSERISQREEAIEPQPLAAVTCGTPGFVLAAGSPYTSASAAASVAIADFNADNKLDLAVANFSSGNVSILLGMGNGTFGAPTNFTVGSNPQSVAIADFNGDNKLDLAVANALSANVSILLGAGNGTFGAATNFTVGTQPVSVAVGNFNADTFPDLAVANIGGGNVSILLGVGNGTFGGATNLTVGSQPQQVRVGDFNADNNLDLAVANNGSNNVSILLGAGNGTFGAATNFAVGTLPLSLVVADFNNDNKLDIVAANRLTNNLSLLTGVGNGSFNPAITFGAGGQGYRSIETADFNGDSKLDLAVANNSSSTVSIFLGLGNGSFNPGFTVNAGISPLAVATADVSGDGKPDFVTGLNAGGGNVLLSTLTFPGAPNSLMTTAGSPQSANNNTAFATALQATVLDPTGQPVANAPVFFDAPIAGASGRFPGNLDRVMVMSNSSGVATAPTFTANGTAGTYSVTASADNGSAVIVCTTFSLTNIQPCPTITLSPATLPTATTGVAYSQQISASGGNAPYTFTLASGPLPTGLTLSSSGLLSGTTTQQGSFPITVMATATNGCVGTRNYTLTVNCPTITLSPSSLPNATTGTAYSQQITASGGSGSYNFTLASGPLPTGLSLSSSGLLSGTPTQPGSFPITVMATDANSCVGTQSYTLVVTCATITISPATLPTATTGVAYSQQITASGGNTPYTFTLASGPLPTGLTLSSGGLLSGTPTQAGSFPITVMATDTNSCTSTQSYTLTVNCATITITSANSSTATTGVAFSFTVTASGGNTPYTFTSTGTLPPGITLNSSSGALSGTPTAAGVFNFMLIATDVNSCSSAMQSFTLTVTCPSLSISPTSLPNAITGTAYSQAITVNGGNAAFSFAFTGSLPPGISLNSSSGVISGSATMSGSFSFTIIATDTNGCMVSQAFTLNAQCPVQTLTPATIPNPLPNVSYSQQLTAGGGATPYTFSIASGTLPGGITLSTGGLLSGISTAGGSFTFTVQATDANGCSITRSYTIAVCDTSLTSIIASARKGFDYDAQLQGRGGMAPYIFSLVSGALPPGISLSANGNFAGVPTTLGNFNFTVKMTDGRGCIATRSYTIAVTN